MSLTPEAILALLALFIMLTPAYQFIYRFVRRQRLRRADEEAAGTCDFEPCLPKDVSTPFTCPTTTSIQES
jgi:hypothetical protein